MDLGPHLRYNGEDYEFLRCDRSFSSRSVLYAHCRDTCQLAWCERCARSADDLGVPLTEVHHYCDVCEEYYASEKDLDRHGHKQTHLARSLERYGDDCGKIFKSVSGMLVYLESGSSRECRHSESFRSCFLGVDGWRYFCLSCDRDFFRLSALYWHHEDSLDCSYLLKEQQCLAKLRRIIARSWGR
ncbi:hypothetical protein BDV23DRAFT_171644 [Aspergillus alliaceus]|uniref:C2H2-type domain-containing protein n=1 Tax=Petromyces alliaceus TaxID=209559 RepID=A0A5N7CC25_PETAA|nr:hypothetical protein BDV23DRAFT_171644 [Aspergillus alliaceus]